MIYLCSSSPTRAKLLESFGIEFEQKSVEFDEDSIKATTPKEFVYSASSGKMKAAIAKYGLDTPLLCADTVIASSTNEILRKANSIDEAREILLKQSNSTISIITAMHYTRSDMSLVDISATHYKFAKFNEDDLESYLQSQLWQGKAGACMVEGFCKPYIKEVIGYESCAMGLSVEVLRPWINGVG
jgi:septum formation protein